MPQTIASTTNGIKSHERTGPMSHGGCSGGCSRCRQSLRTGWQSQRGGAASAAGGLTVPEDGLAVAAGAGGPSLCC